ncbi:MAG: hypothetical protein RR365_14605 [Bacteroides sp.]
MHSKRRDLLYAAFFLIAVVTTFLLGEIDAFFLTSWRGLILSILILLISGDFLRSTFLRIRRSPEEEEGGPSWSVCIALLVFSLLFFGDLFFIGDYIFAQVR